MASNHVISRMDRRRLLAIHLAGVLISLLIFESEGSPTKAAANLFSTTAPSVCNQPASTNSGVIEMSLAGYPLASKPFFHFVRAFNHNQAIYVTVDTRRFPQLADKTVDVFVVADKTQEQWGQDSRLHDVRKQGPQKLTFASQSLQENVAVIARPYELDCSPADPQAGAIGRGYDVVMDIDRDGQLSQGDIIDGHDKGAGFYVVQDITASGPFQVELATHDGGPWLKQSIYYPYQIESLDPLPLVVIAHGSGYVPQHYDTLARHLASYGYLAVAIDNNTADFAAKGTEASADSLLENTEHLLENLSTIAGGQLAGCIDSRRMIWTGHSTGGEAVVRAYQKLKNGDFSSDRFDHHSIVLVVSIAPVAFLTGDQCSPETVNYHQFLGAADTDAHGTPLNTYAQPFSLFERSTGNRSLLYIHGAGHGDFSDHQGDPMAAGPSLIGKKPTLAIFKGYFVALADWYAKRNLATKDFVTRNFSEFRPMGVPEGLTVSQEFKPAPSPGHFVIDDFESHAELGTSSSGGKVTHTVEGLSEIVMKDMDGSFEWTGKQPSNGMTRARFDDSPRAAVFHWTPGTHGHLEFQIVEAQRDFSDNQILSFRAAQRTRHPQTAALNERLTFSVTLTDAVGAMSTINMGSYGFAINRPYPKDEGGELKLVLSSGKYSVELDRFRKSFWDDAFDDWDDFDPKWDTFEVPGYLPRIGRGKYNFEIPQGQEDVEIDVKMYSKGNGWYGGHLLRIRDERGKLIAEGRLDACHGPAPGVGWQNEFNTVRIRLTDFLHVNPVLDLKNISSLRFDFGKGFGSPMGSLGLDDIEVTAK